MSAENVAANALGMVKETRKFVERAILRTQKALAESEAEGGCDPKYIERIARALREAMTDIDCLPREIKEAVTYAAVHGIDQDRFVREQVNSLGGKEVS